MQMTIIAMQSFQAFYSEL